MYWPHLLAYFLGGAFLANAVPHLVERHDGPAVPEPVRQAARARTFLVDGQRALGLLQRRRGLPPGRPGRRFRSEGHRPRHRAGRRRVPDGARVRAAVRPLPWRQPAGSS